MTAACLAVAAVSFVAHLGAEGHSDECPACEVAAHAIALTGESTDLVAPEQSSAAQPLAALTTPLTAALTSCAPRAPPIS